MTSATSVVMTPGIRVTERTNAQKDMCLRFVRQRAVKCPVEVSCG